MSRKVLITGASGFIGSHVVEKFYKAGYNVRAFIRYNSIQGLGCLEDIKAKNKIEIVRGDIRDFDSVYNAMDGCSSVVHLAALITIPYSYVSPLAYIKTNIEGTYNILESSRIHKVKNIVVTSTSETYGSAQYTPINELHPLVGQSPYAATKIAADQLAISYYRSFSLPVKIIRPFNTYGPRQSVRAIIPSIITQILSGRKTIRVGDTSPTRDFVYVKDTAKGFYRIHESGNIFGEVINVATNTEINMKNLAILISEIIGQKINVVSESKRYRPKNSEVYRLKGDNNKLKKYINWIPEYSLSQGLNQTIEWFKKNTHLFNKSRMEYRI